MKKVVLTFGLISGAIMAVMMIGTAPFADKIGFDKGEILGYTIIILSALLIFFGIRSYRENISGGRLTFGRGFCRYADRSNLQPLLRRHLGSRLFQIHAGF